MAHQKRLDGSCEIQVTSQQRRDGKTLGTFTVEHVYDDAEQQLLQMSSEECMAGIVMSSLSVPKKPAWLHKRIKISHN